MVGERACSVPGEGERKEGGSKKGNEEGYEGVEMWTLLHQYNALYSGHHWEPTFCEVSLTQGLNSCIFTVGVVLRNWAVEHNVAAFSELTFAVRWQGRLSRG